MFPRSNWRSSDDAGADFRRPRATDVYEDYESDERVLSSATGHSSSDMRPKKYQQWNRDVFLAKTAVTRRRVRAGAFGRAS
jgi:hypothetical protein